MPPVTSVFSSDLTTRILLDHAPRMGKKNPNTTQQICSLWCKQMCFNLCLPRRWEEALPSAQRDFARRRSVIKRAWRGTAVQAGGQCLGKEQTLPASPAELLPSSDLADLLLPSLSGQMQNLKIYSSRHSWTLDTPRSCGCYESEQRKRSG